MDLEKVTYQEQILIFEEFNNDMALSLALIISEQTKERFDKPVGIQIYYDGKIVLYYLMVGRKESPWLLRKRKTVLESGHSSLFVRLNSGDDLYKSWENDSEYAICGGGFPIRINGGIRGAICVSGLNHQDDHQLIVDALCKLLEKQTNESEKQND